LLLGWAAFPAILVALVLQAMLFQFGGITALGVNTIVMALPAVIGYLVFSPFLNKNSTVALLATFACGFLSVFLSAVILGLALLFTEENFLEVSAIVMAAHIPIMIIEGIITAICVAFIRKVQPSMLPGSSSQ
jgi:cobalt/nickel transport system permease protein